MTGHDSRKDEAEALMEVSDVGQEKIGVVEEDQEEDSSDDKHRSEEPLKYQRLGIDLTWEPQQSEVYFHMARVQTIENLDQGQSIKVLSLVSNLIGKIENLTGCPNLESLELYQNRIKKIEAIEHLTKLTNLDLSFNKIRKIENLDTLTNLKNLFLSSNRISKIEGLEHLHELDQLELGSNRIREIENLDHLQALRQLWLGRNKLSNMFLPRLPNLTYLSFQCNRLETWNPDLFANCLNVEEAYFSENKLVDPPVQILNWNKLRVLDLGGNMVTSLEVIGRMTNLTELWLNSNQIASLNELEHLQKLVNLETLYLEGNPIQKLLGDKYRETILGYLPRLSQLDALLCKPTTVPRQKDDVSM